MKKIQILLAYVLISSAMVAQRTDYYKGIVISEINRIIEQQCKKIEKKYPGIIELSVQPVDVDSTQLTKYLESQFNYNLNNNNIRWLSIFGKSESGVDRKSKKKSYKQSQARFQLHVDYQFDADEKDFLMYCKVYDSKNPIMYKSYKTQIHIKRHGTIKKIETLYFNNELSLCENIETISKLYINRPIPLPVQDDLKADLDTYRTQLSYLLTYEQSAEDMEKIIYYCKKITQINSLIKNKVNKIKYISEIQNYYENKLYKTEK